MSSILLDLDMSSKPRYFEEHSVPCQAFAFLFYLNMMVKILLEASLAVNRWAAVCTQNCRLNLKASSSSRHRQVQQEDKPGGGGHGVDHLLPSPGFSISPLLLPPHGLGQCLRYLHHGWKSSEECPHWSLSSHPLRRHLVLLPSDCLHPLLFQEEPCQDISLKST